MSYFDSLKNYYVFRYIVSSVTGEPTEHEGEIQAFVKATDPWDACEKAGMSDPNLYGANLVDKIDVMEKAISDERKLLTKISKQLKAMSDEEAAEVKKLKEERPCPNGCGKLDEKYSCDKCGFGHEGEFKYTDEEQKQSIFDQVEERIKEAKADGEDTTDLEKLRDDMKAQM